MTINIQLICLHVCNYCIVNNIVCRDTGLSSVIQNKKINKKYKINCIGKRSTKTTAAFVICQQ